MPGFTLEFNLFCLGMLSGVMYSSSTYLRACSFESLRLKSFFNSDFRTACCGFSPGSRVCSPPLSAVSLSSFACALKIIARVITEG